MRGSYVCTASLSAQIENFCEAMLLFLAKH